MKLCPRCNMETESNCSNTSRGFSFKKNIIIIITAALLALGVGGTAVALGISNVPANRVSRYMGAAERYLSEQNYEQAVIEFQRILEIEPMNVDAYLGLADAYIGMGETDKAIDILREGYEKTGDISLKEELDALEKDTALNLGKQYLSENRFNNAVEQFEKVLAIDKKNVDAYLGLADAYVGLGNTEKALEMLREGLELTGDSRLQAKIDELVEPANSDKDVPEIKLEYGSMGSVTILGEEYDITTTERLLIYNKTNYDPGLFYSELLDDPEAYNTKYPQMAHSVICLNGELSEAEFQGVISEVKKLINLSMLEIDFLDITDISVLAELTNLTSLSFNFNSISNISALERLTNLNHLWLNGNEITDISPIAELTNLKTLSLWEPVKGITPIAGLTGLISFELGADVDLTPLAGLKNLNHLTLAGGKEVNPTPLTGLKNLTVLRLWRPVNDSDLKLLKESLPNCEIETMEE